MRQPIKEHIHHKFEGSNLKTEVHVTIKNEMKIIDTFYAMS